VDGRDPDTPEFPLYTYSFIPLQPPVAFVNQIIILVKAAIWL
jgi:hypothetical protein